MSDTSSGEWHAGTPGVQPDTAYHGLATRTDIGRVRDKNEDAFHADAAGGPLIVADGMGGHSGGEVASQIVVQLLPRMIGFARSVTQVQRPVDLASLYVQTIHAISKLVYERGKQNPTLEGMGSTAVVAHLLDKLLVVVNIGDSRAYLLRESSFECITRDHNVAQKLLERGLITKHEFPTHPGQHALDRYIGRLHGKPAETRCILTEPGDRLLLCSDGLTGMVSEQEIAEMLRQPDLRQAADQLVEAAKAAGGKDNITVVLADLGAPSRSPERQPVAVVENLVCELEEEEQRVEAPRWDEQQLSAEIHALIQELVDGEPTRED